MAPAPSLYPGTESIAVHQARIDQIVDQIQRELDGPVRAAKTPRQSRPD